MDRGGLRSWGEDLELTGSFMSVGPDQQPLLLV